MLKIFYLVLGFVLSSSLAMAKSPEDDLTDTCSYFENRAFGEATSDWNTWLLMLSESCHEALRGAEVPGPDANKDLEYLERLSELRTTVIRMNIARFRDRQAQQSQRILRTVTPSGEYLIAKQMGVIAAYRSWIAANGIDTASAQR